MKEKVKTFSRTLHVTDDGGHTLARKKEIGYYFLKFCYRIYVVSLILTENSGGGSNPSDLASALDGSGKSSEVTVI